jgi:hypothetical protein
MTVKPWGDAPHGARILRENSGPIRVSRNAHPARLWAQHEALPRATGAVWRWQGDSDLQRPRRTSRSTSQPSGVSATRWEGAGSTAYCCAVLAARLAARFRAAAMTNFARSSLVLVLRAFFGGAKSCALVNFHDLPPVGWVTSPPRPNSCPRIPAISWL